MIGKSPNTEQKHLFLPNLIDFIDPQHELCLLADKIDWSSFESDFAPLYSEVGCPAKPIRLMVGLLILKQVYGLGDETVIEEWVSNPYFQWFCGEAVFRWKFPCDPSDLVHFRHRIGAAGVEKILAQSIFIHGGGSSPRSCFDRYDSAAEEYHVSDGHARWRSRLSENVGRLPKRKRSSCGRVTNLSPRICCEKRTRKA